MLVHGDFLFVAYEAVVTGITVSVGCIEAIQLSSGAAVAISIPGMPHAHKGTILALEAVQPSAAATPVLFSGCAAGDINMWSFAGGAWARTRMGDGHLRSVTSLHWHGTVHRLLSGGMDMAVGIWNPGAPDAPTAMLMPSVSGHRAGIVSVRAANIGSPTPCCVSCDAYGAAVAWSFSSPDAMAPVLSCEGFDRNPVTSMEVLDLAGNPTPIIVMANTDGSVVLKSIYPKVETLAVVKRGAAHKTGPALVCKPLPGSNGFLTVGKDRQLFAWGYTGPGGTPPALAAGPAAPAAPAAAAAVGGHMVPPAAAMGMPPGAFA
jgi:WD40 repeat protein